MNDLDMEHISRVIASYPERAAVYVTSDKNVSLDKHKFLVPREMSIGQFLYVLRKRIDISEKEAFFLFVKTGKSMIIPKHTELMGQIYESHKSDNGLLLLHVQKETTFG